MRKIVSPVFSIGLVAKASGEIVDFHLNSPAAKAGLAPASKIIALNGREFSPTGRKPDLISEIIKAHVHP